MQALAADAKRLDEELADPALYDKGAVARLRDLTARRAHITQETGEVETQWLELSEAREGGG
jgi:hypothetical protein